MGVKLFIGKTIQNTLDNLIKWNYKLVPFIANGYILALDLKRAGIKPFVIFDVGANTGQTAYYFHRHFPKADIYSFEPVLSVYKQLVANTAGTPVKCFNMALGAEKSVAQIYKSEYYNGIASINGANSTNLPEAETIEINMGVNICNEHGITTIDILKIDTEGYELPVLKGLEPLLKNHVKFIYVEVCFDPENNCQTYITKLLDYLTPFGFISSGIYNQYRRGQNKLELSHCDLLLTNTTLIAR